MSLCFVLFVAGSCRTARPAGNESALAPVSGANVVQELSARMASVHAVRSLMRIRAITPDRTQSFRAQLLVEPQSGRMQLTAYTPVGTEAMTLTADGEHVIFLDHINRTAWEGSAAELARSVGFLDPQTTPAAWALDVTGFPAHGTFQASDRGLTSISLGDASIAFDPPAFPPHGVTVRRGSETLEITHLELVATDASVPAASIPTDYRCCVAPRI